MFSTLFEVEEIRQQITTEVILLLTQQTKAAKTIKHQISLRHQSGVVLKIESLQLYLKNYHWKRATYGGWVLLNHSLLLKYIF